tara:strand:+ start:10 stop:468 length:459 start_codon:yes stop_codon:yes gene_type:complete
MKGLKHLVECHCVLPQFRNKKQNSYHKFVVFSIIDNADSVIPKQSICNNCGVIHNVYDIGKSEILSGQELGAVMQIKDIKLMIPSSLSEVLISYDCDISVWEHALFVLQNSTYPERIVLNRKSEDDIISGKILNIDGPNKYQIIPYSTRVTT